MSWMHRSISYIQVFITVCVLAGFTFSSNIQATGLTLGAAEELALASDPGVQSVEASKLALEEMSVAAEQLPDPLLKMGLVSLPTDTFNLGQEPMTQVQFGMVQKFPRGKSRALQSQQFTQRSDGLDAMVRDRRL